MDKTEYFSGKSNEQLIELYHNLETAMIDATSWDGVDTTGRKAELKEAIDVLSEVAGPGAPGEREQQAIRALLDEMRRRIRTAEGDGLIQKAAEELSLELEEEEADARITDPDVWKDFHDKFKALVDEELKVAPHNVRDRWLRAYVGDRGKNTEIGSWWLSAGLNEGFQARFDVAATRAGVALGPTQGTNPRDYWLHKVFTHLLKRPSDLLLAANKHGGIILRVCEASAVYCVRLEKKALESAHDASPPSEQKEIELVKKREERAPLKRYRSDLKRAIFAALTKQPNASDLDICRSIDADGTAGAKGDDRTLTSAYMDAKRKPAIQAAISKVRRDMRGLGML